MPDTMEQDLQNLARIAGVDTSTGAPAGVRARVGGAVRDNDRLATIRKDFPDAEPYGPDNFIYTDPKTRRRVLYNPPGFLSDPVGDIASLGREAAQGVGGAIGTAVGGVGGLPGAVVGGGLGSMAGDEIFSLLAGNFNGTVDTRTLMQRSADLGIVGMASMAGDAAGRVLVPPVVRAALSTGLRGFGSARDTVARLGAEAAERLNIRLPAGAASGSRTIQNIEAGLAQTPGGAEPIRSKYEGAVDAFGDRYRATVQNIAGSTTVGQAPAVGAEGAGEAVRRSAQGASRSYLAARNRLDDRVTELVGAGRGVDLAPLARARAAMEAEVSRADASLRPHYQAALDEIDRVLESGGTAASLPFDVLRQIRTNLGAQMDASPMTGEVRAASRRYLNRAYDAMNEALEGTANQAGPDAAGAWNRYNRFVARYRAEGGAGETIEALMGQGGDAERAVKLLMAGDRRGTRDLAMLRGRVEPEEWDEIAAGIIDQLGRARPGQQTGPAGDAISTETFLSNWSTLKEGAKRTLLGGTRYAQARADLDDLARVSATLRDAEKMRAKSNTPAALGVTALLTAIAQGTVGNTTALAGAGAATVGAWGLAKLLENPGVVRTMARAGQAAIGGRDAVVVQELSRLAALGGANGDPHLRAAAEAGLAAMGETLDPAARVRAEEPASVRPPQ